MWLIIRIQSKTSRQVSLQHGGRSYRREKNGIHRRLRSLASIRDNGCLRSISHEEIILTFRLRLLLSSKECIIVSGNIHSTHIDLGGGGNHIRGINASERHSVNFVGSGDQNESRRKDFQANDALATESTSQKNQNSSRSDRFADFRWLRVKEGNVGAS